MGEAGAIERSAMRKAMWRLVPLILAAYVIAYIDRVNVSFAALQMNADLKFSATVYGFGAGVFFAGYGLLEVPSSMLTLRFGPRTWIARIMITWGLLAAAMALVRTPVQFYALRFFLGAAEAGFFPAIIYYLSFWIPQAWRGRVISRFYIAGPVGFLLMGAMAGPIFSLDGLAGVRAWQWLFILQGLPAVVLGLLLLRLLPETPAAASWLTPGEKGWISDQLARNAEALGASARHNVIAMLKNPRVLWFGAIGLLLNLVGTPLALSAPVFLAAVTHLGPREIGYIVGAGGVLGIAFVLVAGWRSDRHQDRLMEAAAFAATMACSLLAMLIAPAPAVVVIGYLLFPACNFAVAMLLASSWADAIHARELAIAGAAINTLWQVGAFISPYGWGIAKDATGGYGLGLILCLALCGCMILMILKVRAALYGGRRPFVPNPAA